ncbi:MULTISPECIES: bifunctional uroporphyrinogen-III C-methyltransferase/uroporphyrinogen-III synthase [Streptomycetaceae]|uniref:uroporphyrinogen-III C-methyltransferase n=1 Tax=Streptantibioticus cattleyicolor (strain ATCC 35852 / DSM 46488 / JCM 4925 / NBRC 14057 / NRRL 8057) TaxID=1003195 RepID=F8JWK1_STREN|nr:MULTISPECIES: bifunctional uroporphyrinogen-III C-methyltransferase/uroporphyrinogen-III synthase [Streptomycetaceae]AEW95784.1 uroporphyrin-III C-methyltransferase/uroporphyrinogen-III synthase [Streptantibioticus cattleyicolor NRRL 8057 = DSM 46488]MYS60327.1 bifunctional uroporphyrinogen-III C-methyltransferase/uroporphyrinogen-III synthase [Streptomyces sp. SID5468]CCB76123.1 Uroporphyrin-III C-methyltransferase/uroporphyrinogen-III synthase [Streptantibioticus cattleyicolor NRRL 8057 = D
MSPTATHKPAAGHVTFLGAGPGDPGLLTLRAVEALADADVLVADPRVLDVVRRHAPAATEAPELTALDGTSGAAAHASKLVMASASNGKRVVRAVAGDPGLDGGAAEEMLACAKAGIPFEVVPGIANAVGVPAYAGVPIGGDVRFLDGTTADARCWAEAGASDATLVVSTTLEAVAGHAAELIAAGRKPDTLLTVTVAGTTTRQRTWTATLATIAAELKATKALPAAEPGQAAIAVVGERALADRDHLSWFETKPLFGWRVLVPRTKEQAASLSDQLRSYGAVPHEVPTIAVEPPRTPQQMERAVKGLVTGRYEWIAFTSVNAVKAVREKFEEYGLDARAFAGIKVAAVGEQTAKALVDFGVKPDLVPSGEQSAAGLLEDWPPYDPVFDPIDRVFLPRADIATETLVAGLIELGWEVDDVTAYRTVRASPPPAETREAIKGGGFDAVLFTSSSTVRNLVGIAGKPHNVTVIACIGPATAKTAEEHGLRVDVMAPEPSVHALAEALADFGRARRAAAVEAGDPVTRPSERRPGARRRARG